MRIDYVSLREAADIIVQTLFAGVSDRPVVAKIRETEGDVADGSAIDDAIKELWNAVDHKKVRVVAFGGRPRRIVRLSPDLTKNVPFLRSPRCGDFSYLRPRNLLYRQLTAEFGLDLAGVTLAFREREIEKLASAILRSRRRIIKLGGAKRQRGRPSRQAVVVPLIREIIAGRKWDSTKSQKALAREVNQLGRFLPAVSEEVVTRAIDWLHEETKDRRYQQIRRKARF
jgi:hypothetical protein